MNILVFNWQDIKNPLGGGAEVHLHEIFKRIAARKHSVTLYCSQFPGAPREEMIDGIRVFREGGRSFFNFFVSRRYREQFRYERYDVVVDDINKIPFYTPRFVKEPLVGIVHHLFDKSIFKEATVLPALYVYGAERLAISVYRSQRMAVVSESTRQELIRCGFPQDRISIVQNAVDHRVYKPLKVKRASGPLIGYLGRLKKYKSIGHLLRAFEIVRRTLPRAELLIIGDGDARRDLEGLARKLNIANAVTFSGFVGSAEKVRLLNKVHVVANTSAKEGWGLTVIEANACGVPVVASNVPGLRDSVIEGKTGFLYDYGDVNQMAEKILLLLKNPRLRLKMRKEALRWARMFDWDDSADAMLGVLEGAIRNGASR